MTRFFLWLVSKLYLLPFSLVAGLGSFLGWLAFYLVGSRRRVVLKNLSLCFPEMTDNARIGLAKAHFKALGRSFLERTYPFHAPAALLEKVVKVEGMEYIDAQIERPIILLAPHFVGLDMGAVRLSLHYQMAGIYSSQKSSVLNDWLLKGRCRFNKPAAFSRQQGVRALIRQMKPGVPVFYLPDLDYGKRDSAFIPLFGIPAATITGLSRLAKITRAAVIPVIVEQTKRGYITKIMPAWDNFPTDDPVADAIRMNAFIEAEIRKLPAQYYWVHKRFKSRPEGEPSFYDN